MPSCRSSGPGAGRTARRPGRGSSCTVRPAPRVVVLSTGTELVPLGTEPGYGQIHDSNGYGLTAAARELGAAARYGGIVPDEPDAVRAALSEAAASADLVLTSGGGSAGTPGTVKEVLTAL